MTAQTKRITLRRLLSVWAVLGVGVWLVLGALWEQGEAECRADDGWFCLGPGVAFAAAGIIVAVACFLSGLVIAIVWTVVEAWFETRRERACVMASRVRRPR
jgi:hypothetical protein